MEEYRLREDPRISVADVQKVLLMMIETIDSICQKNHITYWLNGGSALGAIRHKGFIPWDDDLDIGLLADDFPRFIAAMKQDLPPEYYFDCFETDVRYNVLIPAMKIRLRGTKVTEANWLLRNKCKNGGMKDNDGLFIDVFTYHHRAAKVKENYAYLLKQYLLMPVLVLLDNIGINPVFLKRCYRRITANCDKINKGSGVVGFTWVWRPINDPFLFRLDDILPVKRREFAGLFLPVANNHESFLAMGIGKDWRELPPKNKRVSKHIRKLDLGKYQNHESEKKKTET